MEQGITDIAPTSTAATKATEPEIMAAISSAEGSPDLPLAIRAGGAGSGTGRLLLLLGAGLAIGYAGGRWLHRGG